MNRLVSSPFQITWWPQMPRWWRLRACNSQQIPWSKALVVSTVNSSVTGRRKWAGWSSDPCRNLSPVGSWNSHGRQKKHHWLLPKGHGEQGLMTTVYLGRASALLRWVSQRVCADVLGILTYGGTGQALLVAYISFSINTHHLWLPYEISTKMVWPRISCFSFSSTNLVMLFKKKQQQQHM